ncbi:probable tRNA N6-adenosine threonylcarbamoyltransferase, mitochondrial [Patiria miniata]|uniref:N(6)-L-threonylcarbamoyladenine synthase n=1 Tax=Patiria miniata TaxID=46514 RepID=A0A914BPG7_PATMI|nr:probable tRNA N6-adenosine threonylcarbamoyltransferase, mitochondrial [Patiria miniata]
MSNSTIRFLKLYNYIGWLNICNHGNRTRNFPKAFITSIDSKKSHHQAELSLRRGLHSSVSSLASESRGSKLVLGIETSCDETGAAVVDEEGKVLGEGLYSQKRIHVKNGGVIPTLAQDLHRQHIDSVVQQALRNAGIQLKDVSALATTTMPGLALCLQVGLQYSKDLLRRLPLPFIPVHHMIAHALTIRMIEKIEFPYLVLLVSGGHCLLAVARGVDDFLLLGSTLDNAPGEAFDKVARRLKLHLHPACHGLSGGQAIERLSLGGNIRLLMDKERPLLKHRDCSFSFSGLKTFANWLIYNHEVKEGISREDDLLLSTIPDIAASFQHKVAHHMVTRVARAMEFCRQRDMLAGTSKSLVVSGGVASNAYIRSALQFVCDKHGYQLHCPPPRLCTDNGIMIAWAGMEKFKLGLGIVEDLQSVRYEPKYPIGMDISDQVRAADIKIKRVKFW